MERIDLYPNNYVEKKKKTLFIIIFSYLIVHAGLIALMVVAIFQGAFKFDNGPNIWTFYFIFALAWLLLVASVHAWMIVRQSLSYTFYKNMFMEEDVEYGGTITGTKKTYTNHSFGIKKRLADVVLDDTKTCYVDVYKLPDRSILSIGNKVKVVTKTNIIISITLLDEE